MTETKPVKNKPKVLHAWALFDSANSAHALVITAAIFPAYFLKVTDQTIPFGAWEIHHETLYAMIISFSYMIVVAITPLLSGIADYGERRLWFMKFFTYLGGTACILLYFFSGMTNLTIGILSFMFSIIGFAGGLVFYNSYMPIIASSDKFDRLSARGFAYGYIGSVFLLVGNLLIITYPESIGITDAGKAARISFLSVGIWWILLAQIPFAILPADRKNRFPRRAIKMGYVKIQKVWGHLRTIKNTKYFLLAFFLYSIGVQTTILLAATFAESVMNFQTSELILLILIIQLIAVVGAYVFALLSEWKGNKFSLLTQLFIWLTVCFLAYLVTKKSSFYMVAGLVGLVLGGIQSLSRASYAKLINDYKKDITSYFSFYDVVEKLGIVIGSFCFGLVAQLTGNLRYSALLLGLFFIAGIVVIWKVKFRDKSEVE